mmetsp:Transcript_24111/g.30676  ORF Transcript_24111/g.30676 Transcript_24111/m.30676 type:complete len:81 (+) Transcript_24111:1586-1828(+)
MQSEIGSSRQKRKHNKGSFVPTFLPAPTANWGPKARATGFKRYSNCDYALVLSDYSRNSDDMPTNDTNEDANGPKRQKTD